MLHRPADIEWERRLHARLVAADPAALAEVYDQYAPMVFGVALRVLRDRSSAEDVTQDVFLQAWTRPAAYDPDLGTLRSWLAVLARRRAVDALRRLLRWERRQLAAAAVPAAPPSPEELAVAAAQAKSVRAAVDALPDAQRTPILLAYVDGLTARQIAERLGIPEGTAKSRLRLGLRRVAGRLADEDGTGS